MNRLSSLVLSLLIALAAPAHADIHVTAVYEDETQGRHVELVLADGATTVTDTVDGLSLSALRVQLGDEPDIEDVRNLVISLLGRDEKVLHRKSVSAEELGASKSAEVDVKKLLRDGERALVVDVWVDIKPTSARLCDYELRARYDEGRAPTPTLTKAFGIKTDAKPKSTALAPYPHLHEGPAIALYTFCEKLRSGSNTGFWADAWKLAREDKSLAGLVVGAAEADAVAFEAAHKEVVAGYVRAVSKAAMDGEPILVPAADGGTNLAYRFRSSLRVLNSRGLLRVTETPGDGVSRGIDGGFVDQDSKLHLHVTSQPNGTCPDLSDVRPRVIARLLSRDGQPTISIVAAPTGECSSSLSTELSDYLGEQLELSVVSKYAGVELVLYRKTVTVMNFGLITTFPVVSEVVAATNDWSTKDAEGVSGLPLALIVDVTDGEGRLGAALTFPWKFSANIRGGPDLTDLVSIYPHLSLTFVEDAGPGVSAGLGVLLADVFTFAVGWQLTSGDTQGHTFLLVGVDLKGLELLQR